MAARREYVMRFTAAPDQWDVVVATKTRTVHLTKRADRDRPVMGHFTHHRNDIPGACTEYVAEPRSPDWEPMEDLARTIAAMCAPGQDHAEVA